MKTISCLLGYNNVGLIYFTFMYKWHPGHELNDNRFIIEDVLGVGGLGITYRAQDTLMDRKVAIKTMNSHSREQNNFAAYEKELLEEAKRLARCNHPNIVRFFEVFYDKRDRLWCIVMECIVGQTLEVVSKNGYLAEEEALKYIQQVGAALTTIHAVGILHRDIKPQTIIREVQTNRIVVIGFGIAREFELGKIQTMDAFRTMGFSPPEQYQQQGNFSPALDVYALAATLYNLLTCEVPTDAQFRKHYPLKTPQELNPQISAETSVAIMKGLEMEAINRPQTIAEFLELLEPAQHKVSTQISMSLWNQGYKLQNDRFIIEDCLGGGRFGMVFRAQDTVMDRKVAIKILQPGRFAEDYEIHEQSLVNEAKRLVRCNHPHIVRFLDVFYDEKYRWCIVMEFIVGESLADIIERESSGHLPEEEALNYIQQLGTALTTVHALGILHRDISPYNIIRETQTNRIVLIGFGIGLEIGDYYDSGDHSGMFRYQPIEQSLRQGNFSPALDVYALSATLYELLTGGEMILAQLLRQGFPIKTPYELNPKISTDISAAIMKGLEVEAINRPQTIAEFLELLESARSKTSSKISISRWNPGYKLQNDRFIIEDTLGGGGYGVTYRAHDTMMARKVAIKTLDHIKRSDGKKFDIEHQKFLAEAKRLAQCNHPNIVRVLDIFHSGKDQLWCMVMECVVGQTLQEIVDDLGQVRLTLSQSEALTYIHQVGTALTAVHALGMLHRDVKPHNILCEAQTNRIVLIDFGLAREFDLAKSGNMTEAKTTGYAPPEQYERCGNFTPALDVYSLAATLYTLLTGGAPMDAKYRKNYPLKTPQELNPQIPTEISEAIMKGMELEARNRPQTVAEFLSLL